MSNPRQITDWQDDTPVERKWMEREKERIESHGKACEIITNPIDKEIALFYKNG